MPALFVDVECSGLYRRNKPADDPSQPWCVSIAADLRDDHGIRIPDAWFSLRIRADGRSIEPAAEAVHGISTREARSGGVNEIAALGCLIGLVAQADVLVGHGLDFDWHVINSLLVRRKNETAVAAWNRPRLRRVCTMIASTEVCQIPSETVPDTFKWPSLDEAAAQICGIEPRTGPHSPWDDVQRTAAIYFSMVRTGLLEPSEAARDITLPDDPAFGFQPLEDLVT